MEVVKVNDPEPDTNPPKWLWESNKTRERVSWGSEEHTYQELLASPHIPREVLMRTDATTLRTNFRTLYKHPDCGEYCRHWNRVRSNGPEGYSLQHVYAPDEYDLELVDVDSAVWNEAFMRGLCTITDLLYYVEDADEDVLDFGAVLEDAYGNVVGVKQGDVIHGRNGNPRT